MILCDANQITILQIKVILSRKNWSHLTLPTSYPKYLLILALMNENCLSERRGSLYMESISELPIKELPIPPQWGDSGFTLSGLGIPHFLDYRTTISQCRKIII